MLAARRVSLKIKVDAALACSATRRSTKQRREQDEELSDSEQETVVVTKVFDMVFRTDTICDRKSEFVAHAFHLQDSRYVPHVLKHFKENEPLTSDAIHPAMYAFRIRGGKQMKVCGDMRGMPREEHQGEEEGDDYHHDVRIRVARREQCTVQREAKVKAHREAENTSPSQMVTVDNHSNVEEGSGDDGESGAGRRILQQMRKVPDLDAALVVVSRWYGGSNIGNARFRHIQTTTDVALEALLKELKGKGGE